MVKELLNVFSNWKFWWFCYIALFPVWFGIIGMCVVYVKEKIASYFNI